MADTGEKSRRKKWATRGFTMVELMVTLGILSLTILAGGVCISAATRVYTQSTLTSEAAVLLSTLSQAVTDEIRWATDVEVDQYETTLYYSGRNYGADQDMRAVNGRIFVGDSPLLSDKAYTSGLSARISFEEKGGPLRVYINVYNEAEELRLGQTFYVTPVNGGGAVRMKPVDLGAQLDNIKRALGNRATANIDSNAASRGSQRVAIIVTELAAQGIDLSENGIRTWRLKKEGSYYLFYWTDQDVSILPVGTWVRVIRYNEQLDTYTAGHVQVGTSQLPQELGDPTPYHTLSDWVASSEAPGQTAQMKKDFNSIYEFFLTLPTVK